MKKYFALYLASAAIIAEWAKGADKEKMDEYMDRHSKWMKDHAKIFVDEGTPLGKTKRITAQGITDTKNEIVAYSIIEAESHEAAAKLLADHPHLTIPGTFIEIMEVRDMSKM